MAIASTPCGGRAAAKMARSTSSQDIGKLSVGEPFREDDEQAKYRRDVQRLGEHDPRKGFALISDSPVLGRLKRRIFLQLSPPTR